MIKPTADATINRKLTIINSGSIVNDCPDSDSLAVTIRGDTGFQVEKKPRIPSCLAGYITGVRSIQKLAIIGSARATSPYNPDIGISRSPQQNPATRSEAIASGKVAKVDDGFTFHHNITAATKKSLINKLNTTKYKPLTSIASRGKFNFDNIGLAILNDFPGL